MQPLIRRTLLLVGILIVPLAAPAQPAPLFTLVPASHSGVTFANVIVDTDHHNIIDFIYAYNGSGVAAGDVDGDGRVDLFFCATQAPNRLYLNRGDFRFEDVSARAGVDDSLGMRSGATMVDIDADGDLDIYVCKQEHANTLFVNNGDGTFTESARSYGLAHDTASTAATFLDYDRDGDLDVYLLINGDGRGENYVKRGLPDRLYRNNGDRTFTDVSAAAGIRDAGYGLSATVGDLDDNGWPDIVVANDFEARSLLWMNNGDGTFTESMKSRMGHSATFAMGTDIADFNNDGHLDMVEVDMLPEDHERKNRELGMSSVYSPLFDSLQHMRNGLYLNRGDGTFSDIAYLAGVAKTDWSWASLFADFDLDGWKDLFIANGIKRDLGDQDYLYSVDKRVPKLEMLKKMPTTLLQNYVFGNRRDLTFENLSDAWGLTERVNTQGAAYADLDNDGDLDLVLSNTDTNAFIYRNNAVEQKRGHWLAIKLDGPIANPLGIGARVTLRSNDAAGAGSAQVHEMQLSRGYLSSVEPIVHFGLQAGSAPTSVEVRWPDGRVSSLSKPALDGFVRLAYETSYTPLYDTTGTAREAEMIAPASIGLDFRHVENPFSDFDRERLLPNRLSQGGPGIAVGDVDGNGLDDLYIGGAKFQSGALYLQTSAGRFSVSKQPAFEADRRTEDMGALFCDVDGDHDLDLYVVSGGSEYAEEDAELQDRLYRNNGRGMFTKDSSALPSTTGAGSAVVAADFDGDGDRDLFVAGRAVPGRYPATPRSYLLENRKGVFADVTATIVPMLMQPGMISSALWSDYDNDGDPDLLLAGEWTTPLVLRNDRGRLVDATASTGLDSAFGWWTSISPGDFDNDGDIDYILGNWGLNTRYQPTASEPIELFALDFDGNGSIDPIMSYYSAGRRYPTRDKQSVASQIPSISRRFPKFYQFARATLDQLLPKDSLARARHFRATTLASSHAENLGGGRFRLVPLPNIAQTAPVFGTSVDDVDRDGRLDLLLVGNFHGPEPEMKRYDALAGLVLLGDGAGGFAPREQEPFRVVNNARALVRFADASTNSTLHVASTCNDAPYVFRERASTGSLLPVDPRATHAVITLADGRTRRQEFPCGGGYLSQSSSTIALPEGTRAVTLYNGKKKLKEIRP